MAGGGIPLSDVVNTYLFSLRVRGNFCVLNIPNLLLGDVYHVFVELGGGVGEVPFWCRDGAYVEFGFR